MMSRNAVAWAMQGHYVIESALNITSILEALHLPAPDLKNTCSSTLAPMEKKNKSLLSTLSKQSSPIHLRNWLEPDQPLHDIFRKECQMILLRQTLFNWLM